MSNYPDPPLNPYRTPGPLVSTQLDPRYPAPHSGPGVASFVLGLIGGISGITLLVVAGMMHDSTPGGMSDESGEAIAIGLAFFVVVGASFIGAVLGIVGLLQRHRQRVFPILGLLFNGLVIAGMLGILVLGLTMGE